MYRDTKTTILEKEEIQAGYNEALGVCIRIKTALTDYKQNKIDKRFFEKFFLVVGEHRTYTEFSISEPVYGFQTGKRIWLNKNHDLELENRDKAHIMAKLDEKIELLKTWMADNQKRIDGLKSFDEVAFYKDLTALYNKHGRPDNWRDLLEGGFYQRVGNN